MYKRILVAVELAEGREIVVQRAADIANAMNAKLSLINVVKHHFLNAAWGPKDSIGTVMPAQPTQVELEEKINNAKAKLQNLAARVGAPDAECHVWLSTSTVAAIRKVAQNEQADLIVIGGYPEKGVALRRLLLGATGRPILRKAQCDILVVDFKSTE